MRILIITAYYEPEITAGLYLLKSIAEGLAKKGNTVIILTPSPSRGFYDRKKPSRRERIPFNNGSILIIRYISGKEFHNFFLRIIRYVLNNLITFIKSFFIKYDILFVQSTPPTQGFFAAFIKKFNKKPFIYNIQDLFPESMVNSKIIKKKSFLYFLGYKMERFARNNADHIIVISKSFENYLLGQNLTKDKISVVENWVAENIIFPIDKNLNPLLTKFGLKQNDFIIYYSGNIGYTQNIDIIIDIAEELDYISDLIFVIVGEGVFKRHLIHEINVRKIKNVLLFPFQDYSLISNVFSIGDVGLILSKKGIGSNSIPSKTWSIMAAQRCVLASFDINSPLGDVILQANCGFIIEPENKPKLLEAILQLYLNRNSLEEFGINGRKYILENMNPERSVERYIEAFEHIYTKAHTHT